MASSNSPRKIQLSRIANVRYTHKSIDSQRDFLTDFGFTECSRVGKKTYYRGYGDDPWVYCAIEGDEDMFGGAGFVVESLDDLEYATNTLPGASAIYELDDAPGGGQCVTFHDPVDGWPMHLIWGQNVAEVKNEPQFPKLDFNYVCLQLQTVTVLLVLTHPLSPRRKQDPQTHSNGWRSVRKFVKMFILL
jgi:hypothetical protein